MSHAGILQLFKSKPREQYEHTSSRIHWKVKNLNDGVEKREDEDERREGGMRTFPSLEDKSTIYTNQKIVKLNSFSNNKQVKRSLTDAGQQIVA